MPVSYNFRRGIDLPSWHWLNQFPQGPSSPGTAHCWDGVRYQYWAVQYGSTTVAGTTQLWRYDTWTNTWNFIVSLTSIFQGIDIDYDPIRNVIWIVEGNATTAWRYFNLNTTPITLAGLTTAAYALSAAIATVLPAAANPGANIDASSDGDVPAALSLRASGTRDVGTAAAGSTATSIVDTTAEFHSGMVGSYVRFTSGTLAGQQRVITAATLTALTVTAFGGAPAPGDTFVVEVPGGTPASANPAGGVPATGGGTSTVVATGSGWPVNVYRDADVVIVSGTGAGQRRRIASNTIDTLTLAGAVAGNPRTGPFTTAPDATSVFRIMPSEDFLYYVSNTTALYRCDVAATAVAWAAQTAAPAANGAGAYMGRASAFAPFSVVVFRGAGTATVYRYDVGLATWATLPSFWGGETLNLGGSVTRLAGRHRFAIHVGGSSRLAIISPATGLMEGVTLMPYAPPAAYDGKRMRFHRTPDGAEFLYLLRAGGQEFFRLPLEWLT